MNGPNVVAYPRPRGYRLAGPEAVAVCHVLGLPRTVTADQLPDVEAYCAAARLLLVIARPDRRTTR